MTGVKSEESKAADRDLMLGFCSLGHNCEFGLVQRAFGAESLDLLRWAATEPEVLMRMMEDRFERFNDPEQITMYVAGNGERMIRHKYYGFHGHAHVPATTSDDILLTDLRRRLPWLARKLMADLAEASRIFVIRPFRLSASAQWTSTAENVERILELMESFGGKPHLLFVREGGEVRVETGAVQRLISGWVPAFVAHGEPWKALRSDDWLRLCRMARGTVGRCVVSAA